MIAKTSCHINTSWPRPLGAQGEVCRDIEMRASFTPKVFVWGKAEYTGAPSAQGSGLSAACWHLTVRYVGPRPVVHIAHLFLQGWRGREELCSLSPLHMKIAAQPGLSLVPSPPAPTPAPALQNQWLMAQGQKGWEEEPQSPELMWSVKPSLWSGEQPTQEGRHCVLGHRK